MTTPTHTMTRLAIVLGVAVTALALVVPLAQAAPGVEACPQTVRPSPYPGWVVVIDEQGVETMYQVGYAPTGQLSCASSGAQEGVPQSPDGTADSPYLGWVVVIDEQGVPTLFPRGPIVH